MSVSIFNSKQQLIEESVTLASPVIAGTPGDITSDFYWGSTWDMQTPLENLEPGSTLLVEFKDSADRGGAESASSVVHYIAYPVDAQTIDSTIMSASWRILTIDLGVNVNNKIQRVSTLLSGGGNNQGGNKLEVDLILHQRSRAVDVKSIMLN